MTKEELEKLREEAFWRGDMDEVNRINKLLNIKSKPVNEDAIYNLGFLPEYTITAADPNRPTSPKNVIKTFAYSPIDLSKTLAQGANQGYTWVKNNPKEAAEMALDFTPVVGDVKGLTYDVYQGARQGGWQGGATAAGLGLLGLIPGLGDVASKGFRTSIKEATKAPYKYLKTLKLDWKNSKKSYTESDINSTSNFILSRDFKTIENLLPNRSFSDRLAYMALVPRENKDAVNSFVRLINNPEISRLQKKWDKLYDKEAKMKKGVFSDWISNDFPLTFKADNPKNLTSDLGGVLYNVKLAPSELKYLIGIKPFKNSFYLKSNKARTLRIPLELNNTPLKNYIKQVQDEFLDLGYVGGSTRLLAHYNLPDVPGDLEIITTEARLQEMLKKFPDLTGGKYKLNNSQLKTLGFNNSRGINKEIDADIILQDAQGKAKGRMAHLIWSATQPEEYKKWLLEFLAKNPNKYLDDVSLPLSAEEIYLLGKANPEKQVLYDLIKARGKGTGKRKKNLRNWDLMHPETLPAVREATENIVRTYMPNYKSFKEQFPDFDYSNIEANLRLLNHLGYDVKIAEDPLLMLDLMEILNANALKGRRINSKTLVNGATPEIALRSLWAPLGGNGSGAGGNTIATTLGAEGFGDFAGILLNDRSKDIIKNSDDYLQAFNRELYRNKKGDTHVPLPEELISDLKTLGINAKTNSDLNGVLHIDPESDLGKQIYPLLNKHGIRNINSTDSYSSLGDGAFYSGNLDTDALLTLYNVNNTPYIELPHAHGMYDDAYTPYEESLIPSISEKPLFEEKLKLVNQSYNRLKSKSKKISKKLKYWTDTEKFNDHYINYDLDFYKNEAKNKIKNRTTAAVKGIGEFGIGFGVPALGIGSIARMGNNSLKQNKPRTTLIPVRSNTFKVWPANAEYKFDFNQTPGTFENPNDFYINLRLNYIKTHPELKLIPKNY